MTDVKNECLSLQLGEEKLEFNLSKVTASPSLEDACYQVDVIDKVVFEEMGTLNLPLDPLKGCVLGTLDKRVDVKPSNEREVYTHILDMGQPFPPQHHPRQILNVEVGPFKEDKRCTA